MAQGRPIETINTEEFEALRTDLILGTAAEHASEEVPTAAPTTTAAEAFNALSGNRFSTANAVAVLEAGRLVGVLPITRLIDAPPERPIGELMDRDPPTVSPDADQEGVALAMIEHDASVLAVVDADGRFVGLIPPRRLLRVLLEEHEEDLARLGGFLVGSRQARRAAEEPVTRRIWHRLPWLLIGLLGAMASVAVVAGFERQLDEKVLIAFFLPAVVYMADAVGTQTEALMIRALAVGVSWPTAIRRELLSGIAIGALVGAAFVPFALAGWGDGAVAVAVGISLLAACATATAIAIALPFALQRLGADPAFGSGPLATVLQDLISIAVYLGVAVQIAS